MLNLESGGLGNTPGFRRDTRRFIEGGRWATISVRKTLAGGRQDRRVTN